MSKIDMSRVLKNFNGDPLPKDTDVRPLLQLIAQCMDSLPEDKRKALQATMEAEAKKEMLTLRTVLVQAAGASLEGLSGDECLRIFQAVAKMPAGSTEVEFTSEEQTLLKKVVGLAYRSPMLVGQAQLLLDGKEPFA